jgi:putative membrane protein
MKQKYFAFLLAGALLFSACDDDDDNANNDLTQTDRSFVETAARSNLAEIELGGLAASMGSAQSVRDFGAHMVEEHTTAQDELRGIADDFDNTNWPDELDDQHEQVRDQLMTMTGYQFDSMYMASPVMDHEMADSLFSAGMTRTSNSRVKEYAAKYHPHIEEHLQQADSIYRAIVAGNEDDGN